MPYLESDAAEEEYEKREGAAIGQKIMAFPIVRRSLHLHQHVARGEGRPNHELHQRALPNHDEDADSREAARHLAQLPPEGPPVCDMDVRARAAVSERVPWAECTLR